MRFLVTAWKDYDEIERTFDDQTDANLFADGLRGNNCEHVKVIPVIRCKCGEEIICDRFTNTCDCGRDYNFAGHLLAPREFWGEETGETWRDCL
jgi:hypothetical protein